MKTAKMLKRKRQRRQVRANRRRRTRERKKELKNSIEAQQQMNKEKITQMKQKRKLVESADKAYASALVAIAKVYPTNKRYPHMEWDGHTFTPTLPAPPPVLDVTATMMPSAHGKLGVKWTGSRHGLHKSHTVTSLADSGCQTTTAGVDFLESIGCPQSYLIPTSHQIIGITSSSLHLLGAVMIRFDHNGKTARQMVHIPSKLHGLYLSKHCSEAAGSPL